MRFLFFKQKTAYEMRISDWSSDVCSSDLYTPHTHGLGFLRTQAERLDRRLTYVWPMANRKQRAMFEKLKDVYVKARYSKHYRISKEELTWLGERVEELGQVVHEICSERIAQLDRKSTRLNSSH